MLYDEGFRRNRTVCIVDIDLLPLLQPGELLQSESVKIGVTVVLGVARRKVTVCTVEVLIK